MRFLPFLVLLSALAIAGCAAFFSIVGLKLLFVGGGLSIVVMGVALEVGKLITATFLKQKWKEISIWMRTYMVIATLTLVAITSIGIYGFLSAGYTATAITVQGYERQIEANTLKSQTLEKEILVFRADTFNAEEIAAVNDTRKTFADQRLQLVNQRNAQIEKIRGDAKTTTASEDIASAKQALDLAKASLDSDTNNELGQIKLYNARLEILDKEVQKWLDEGRGSIFRKGGLDKARETKAAQKSERGDIDAQIKKSQDRIDSLRIGYSTQVKEYNDRVAEVELRSKSQRAEVDSNIKGLEKENAEAVASITLYNKEADDKIAALNIRKEELSKLSKAKVAQNQEAVEKIHLQNDELRQNIAHTDVGTFKFIAKSLNIPLDKAVNYFVWMIMVVFDPLAVCLILAFNVLVGSERVVVDKPKPEKKHLPTLKIEAPQTVPEIVPVTAPNDVAIPAEIPVEAVVPPEVIPVEVPPAPIPPPQDSPPKPSNDHGLREHEIYHAPTR